MPNISSRGHSIQASPIRSLVPYARKAEKEGKKVYYLNIGQPDIPTPEKALVAMRQKTSPIIKYGPSEGFLSLREKVADYYLRFNADLSPSDIVVTTGASEAILFVLLACCDTHDEIIIPEPFYANYIGFAHTSNVRIVAATTTLEDKFKLPEPQDFEKLISPKTKAILLCNPGNPTGQLYTKDQLQQLISLVIERDLFLIVDEVYKEFCYDQDFTSVLSFNEASKHVIVIDSISKVFSSCGARVGYLITKNASIIENVIKFAQMRLCPPHFGQVLAEACYDGAIDYIQEAKEEYKKRREVLHKGLSKIEGLKTYKPDAAFYNIVELPIPDVTKFCTWMLKEFEYNNQTVMLAPADGFYKDPELGKNQARIAYVLNSEHLENALTCLGNALVRYASLVESKSLSS